MGQDKGQQTWVCQRCGNEADLTIAPEVSSPAERTHEHQPKQRTLVCKVCGSEADIILEEV